RASPRSSRRGRSSRARAARRRRSSASSTSTRPCGSPGGRSAGGGGGAAAVWGAGAAGRWREALTVPDAVAASDAETTRENEIERTRLEMMRRYAEHTGCRRSFLLSYFGQDYPGPCGNCDNDGRAVTAEPTLKPFAVGERVISERWGDGTVQRYDGDQLTVLFDEHGYRDLLLS